MNSYAVFSFKKYSYENMTWKTDAFSKADYEGQLQDLINYLSWYMANTIEPPKVCGSYLLLLVFQPVDLHAYFICTLLTGLELSGMKFNPAEGG